MMKAGKELNLVVSQKVLGHDVVQDQNGVHMEATHSGVRPLRPYSTHIEAAWEVVERFGITLIPIEDGSWFAFVGETVGWKSPTELIEYLNRADFGNAGAAVAPTAPLSICLAAIRAIEKRVVPSSTSRRPTDTTSH